MSRIRLIFVYLLIAELAKSEEITSEKLQFFETNIRPILVEKCYDCHSQKAEKIKGGLLLDTREGIRKGGDDGPAVVPGDLTKSLLISAIRYEDEDTAMPPKKKGGKLSDQVIANFETWIKMGAPDPRDGPATVAKTSDAKSWWAYQPVKNVAVPETDNSSWARSDIDLFIEKSYAKAGLQPVADASAEALVRRMYLDLTGIPPSANKVLEFTENPNVEKLVDQLLDTRQFAERWARHWLDVARYAESSGRDVNVTFPEAWRYRDYVIDSFFEDKPFDQMLREQLAGDLLPYKNEKEHAEQQIATGFLAIGAKALNETNPRQFAVDLADEQINTVSQAFLGQTISCARCHDHKFDPISQTDYTAIAGIFLSTKTQFGTIGGVQGRNASTLIDVANEAQLPKVNRTMDPKEWATKKAEFDLVAARRDEALAARRPGRPGGSSTPDPTSSTANMTGFDIVRLITRAKQLEVELGGFHPDGSAKTRIMGVTDQSSVAAPIRRAPQASPSGNGGRGGARRSSGFETIADSPLFIKGSIETEGSIIPRGLPVFLSNGNQLKIPTSSSGRLELAEWMVSPQNSLTSRVIVNRVWSWLFGEGIVGSVDNFGTTGSQPSNPELLDFLAAKFVADGWSMKKLIRAIVLSRVYQLQTANDKKNYLLDPGNLLLWRATSRQLDAETIRDSVLAASGSLDKNPQLGSLIALAGDGPISGERFHVLDGESLANTKTSYRSIYLPLARNAEPEMLETFDFSDSATVQGKRESTIVPPQALFFMNSEFIEKQSALLAMKILEALPQGDFSGRYQFACLTVFSRKPTENETRLAETYFKSCSNPNEAWQRICRALFSSAEFRFPQ